MFEQLNSSHTHPLDQTQAVFGKILYVGERLQDGDVYDDAITKKWQPVPRQLFGQFIQSISQEEGDKIIFVRPAPRWTTTT